MNTEGPATHMVGLLWPLRCPFCGAVTGRQGLCDACAQREKGLRMGGKAPPCPDFLDKLTACYYNISVVRRGLLRMKYGGAGTSARFFAGALAQKLGEEGCAFDGVVPVPPDKRSRLDRAYDIPALMAGELSARLGIPVLHLLEKQYSTAPQHTLPRPMRGGNLAGAFGVAEPARAAGGRFLLCDDIVTTGATLNECAKTLRLFGAAAVYGAAAAYTPTQRKRD